MSNNMKTIFSSLLALTCVTSIVSAQLPSYVPVNGLISWWGFNGDADDLSSNGNNGTVNRALLTEDRFINPDNAFAFDGIDDDILLGIDSDFRLEVLTVSSWIKTSTDNAGYQTIFSYFINTPDGYAGYWLGLYGNYACFFLGDGISGGFNILGTDLINDGLWHFLVATYDNNDKATLYVDDLLQNIQVYTAVVLPATAQIGNDYLGEIYQGILDDIGVWNRDLTETEIHGLYNAALSSLYPLDNTSSFKAYPNPASTHITIDIGDFALMNGNTIRIDNVTGVNVFSQEIHQQQFEINLFTWTGKGVYFLYLIDPGGKSVDVKKIVLQ